MTAVHRSRGAPDGFGGWGRPGTRRVVMALHDAKVNGASIAALRAVPALAADGWSIAFWTPAPGGCFDWLAERGAEVHGAPKPIASGLLGLREPPGVRRRLLAAPGYLRGFAGALRELRPQVVHANSLYSFAEAATARSLRVPTVLHLHDMAPRSWKAAPAAVLARRGMNQAIAVSRACAASYRRDSWEPDVVYESAPVPSEPFEIREAPRPFVVGTVGVVARRKGIDLFVGAAKRLARERSLEFRLVGSPDDPLEREWGEGVIADAVRAGVVHIPRADVAEELSHWDAFALASRMDPCPLVMLEAMAGGLPVIGARRDGIAEQVTPECGVLVAPEDAKALADGIAAVAAMPAARRRELGSAARERVRAAFSVEAQANGIGRAYRRALGVDDGAGAGA